MFTLPVNTIWAVKPHQNRPSIRIFDRQLKTCGVSNNRLYFSNPIWNSNKSGLGSVLDNLSLNNSLTHIFRDKYENIPPAGKLWLSLDFFKIFTLIRIAEERKENGLDDRQINENWKRKFKKETGKDHIINFLTVGRYLTTQYYYTTQ